MLNCCLAFRDCTLYAEDNHYLLRPVISGSDKYSNGCALKIDIEGSDKM